MPMLRELDLILDANEWDKAAPAGLRHLPSLEKITTWYITKWRSLKATDEDRKKAADSALIRSVFQEDADALSTRPEFALGAPRMRPTATANLNITQNEPVLAMIRDNIGRLIVLCYVALHVPWSEELAQAEVLTVILWASKQAHMAQDLSRHPGDGCSNRRWR